MRVLPILFNTDMVRALLENRKTVTRRVVKPQREKMQTGTYINGFNKKMIGACSSNGSVTVSPYQSGDILYVRETWCDINKPGIEPDYYYFADTKYFEDYDPSEWKWSPSIHMPKEAARIFLRVKNVRVERLQDISEEQAQAEGFYKGWKRAEHSSMALTATQAFMWMWDYTIKPADRVLYGWLGNPWVWVIEFEKIGKEEIPPCEPAAPERETPEWAELFKRRFERVE